MATAFPTYSFVNSNKGKSLLVVDDYVFQQQSLKFKAGSQQKKAPKVLAMQKQIENLSTRFCNGEIDLAELLEGLSLLVASKK